MSDGATSLELTIYVYAVDIGECVLGEIGVCSSRLTVKKSGHADGDRAVTQELVTISGFVII